MATPPPPARALCDFGLKMPILGQKQCFLGSGGRFKAPQCYFAGAPIQRGYVAGLGIREMGDSGPPLLKKTHFLPKNGLKMPFFGEIFFFGLGWAVQDPLTLFSSCSTQRDMFCRVKQKRVLQGRPPPKNGHFLPKNGLKLPFISHKKCFLGLEWSVQGPQPYFTGAGVNLKMYCRVRNPKKG